MDAVEKQYPYFYFTTVNRRTNPYIAKDEELRNMVNFWTEDEVGSKKARPGYSLFLDRVDNDPVTGLFYVKFANGNVRLARISGDNVYVVDPLVDSAWGTAAFTNSSSNAFVNPEYTVLSGKAHIVSQISNSESLYLEWNNADTITQRTTVSATDLVTPFSGRTVAQYHRRVYVGSPYDLSANLYRSRLSWSSIDYEDGGTDPASPWTIDNNDVSKAGFRDIDTDYKGSILKITNINDRLNVYKEGGIYRYNETSMQELFGVAPYRGSISTMEELKEDYFFTNEGFFKTDGKSIEPVGDGWYPIFKQILRNGIDTDKIHSASVNFLYFCYMGDITYDGETVENACFVYNAYYDEMYLWSFGHDITSIGYFTNANGEKEIVLGDVNGFTYKLDYDADDDNGQPIRAFFDTQYFFFDQPQLKNQMTEVYPFATRGSQIKVLGDTDFKNQYKEFMQIADKEAVKKIEPSLFGLFTTLSLRFAWNGEGKRPEVFGSILTIKANMERPRHGA